MNTILIFLLFQTIIITIFLIQNLKLSEKKKISLKEIISKFTLLFKKNISEEDFFGKQINFSNKNDAVILLPEDKEKTSQPESNYKNKFSLLQEKFVNVPSIFFSCLKIMKNLFFFICEMPKKIVYFVKTKKINYSSIFKQKKGFEKDYKFSIKSKIAYDTIVDRNLQMANILKNKRFQQQRINLKTQKILLKKIIKLNYVISKKRNNAILQTIVELND